MKTLGYTFLFGLFLFAFLDVSLWLTQGANPLYLVAASIGGMLGGIGTLAALVVIFNGYKAGEYVARHIAAPIVAKLRTAAESR